MSLIVDMTNERWFYVTAFFSITPTSEKTKRQELKSTLPFGKLTDSARKAGRSLGSKIQTPKVQRLVEL